MVVKITSVLHHKRSFRGAGEGVKLGVMKTNIKHKLLGFS